jgi:hypothetical protein
LGNLTSLWFNFGTTYCLVILLFDMTNSSPQTPPPSSEEQRIRQQIDQRARQETTDEWIAIVVAFATIGAILLWSLGFRKNNFVSTQWDNMFARSGDRVEDRQGNNFRDDEVFTTADNLELSEPRVGTFARETPLATADPFVDENLSDVETNQTNRRERNFFIPTPLPPDRVTPKATAPKPTPEATAPAPVPVPAPEATAPETVVSFDDVTDTHWAYPFIQELGKQKLIGATSDNNFEPDKLITRAGMATLISQAFNQPTTQATKQFNDIDDGNVTAEDIDKAVSTGFMKGYSDDEFRPTENIPRYQVLVALATGLGLEPSGDPLFILQDFSDRDQIPEWAISQVAAATEAGLTVNRPDFGLQSLNPEEPATRAEVAAMIYQTLQQLDKVEKIDSPYIVPKP